MTRGQLLATGLAEVGVVALAGAVAASGAAVAASPLMPIGAARLAEPSPGVSADTTVLSAGAAMITILMLARAAWPAWRLASAGRAGAHGPAATRRSLAAGWLSGAGAPVTAVIGVHLALERGRGRSAMPVRTALASTALPLLAVAAAFTFGANLLHLVHSPRLYGQSWDAAIDLQFQTVTPSRPSGCWAKATRLSSWSYGDQGVVGINGQIVPAIGVAPGRGPLVRRPCSAASRPDGPPDCAWHLGAAPDRPHGGQMIKVTATAAAARPHRRPGGIPGLRPSSFTPTGLGLGAETIAAVLQPQASFTGRGPH